MGIYKQTIVLWVYPIFLWVNPSILLYNYQFLIINKPQSSSNWYKTSINHDYNWKKKQTNHWYITGI